MNYEKDAGRVLQTTDERGKISRVAYDDALNHRTQITYDVADRATAVTKVDG